MYTTEGLGQSSLKRRLIFEEEAEFEAKTMLNTSYTVHADLTYRYHRLYNLCQYPKSPHNLAEGMVLSSLIIKLSP